MSAFSVMKTLVGNSSDTLPHLLGNLTTIKYTTQWNYVSVCSLLIFLVAFTFNSFLLVLILQKKRTQASFNVYVISLLVANNLYELTGGLFDFINDLYSVWSLGGPLCSFYQYGLWALSSTQIFMHLLISANRFTAAAYPLVYRQRHTFLTAVGLSVGAWLAAHCLVLPGIIKDAVNFVDIDLISKCFLNYDNNPGERAWQVTVQFSTLFVLVTVAGMHQYILYREYVRGRIVPKNALDKASTLTTATRQLRRRASTLLTVLTISLVIFWTPATLYFAVVPLRPELFNDNLAALFNLIFSVQAVADPIILGVAVLESEQRSWILRLLRFRDCRIHDMKPLSG